MYSGHPLQDMYQFLRDIFLHVRFFWGLKSPPSQKSQTTKKVEDHMGEDPGLWYSNWHHGSLVARQLLQEVETLADGSEESGGSEVMRKRPGLESWVFPFVEGWFVRNGYTPQN